MFSRRTPFLSLALLCAPAARAQSSLPDTSECTYDSPDEAEPVISLYDLPDFLGLVSTYTADPTALFDGYWTSWYHDEMQVALAKLAVMRGYLEAVSLVDTHLPGALVGNDDGTTCGDDAERYRSYDGSCNDLDDPLMGAAGTRFSRNVPLAAAWPDEEFVAVYRMHG